MAYIVVKVLDIVNTPEEVRKIDKRRWKHGHFTYVLTSTELRNAGKRKRKIVGRAK